MNDAEPFWELTDCVPKDRREKMLALRDFDEVIQLVIAGIVDEFKFELRSEYSRIFFRLNVRKTTYDAFLNSSVGYRAQYCIGVENGRKQNRRLIDAVTPLLLESVKETNEWEYPREKILASLSGTGAKVWINDEDWPDIDEIHINHGPWVAKANAAKKGTIAEQVARTNAAIGVLAPENIYLEIKGGWLTFDNREWHDPEKALRAEEIRDYGTT